MNGETFSVNPDFTVVFGFRSALSLVGLATGVLGYWLVEREWDNFGTNTLKVPADGGENGESSDYVDMNDRSKVVAYGFHYSGARDIVRVRTDESDDRKYHPKQAAAKHTDAAQSIEAAQYYGDGEAVKSEMMQAYPEPRMMLIGMCIWSASFFFDPSEAGFRIYANIWNVTCVLLSAVIGPLIAYPMRLATLERDLDRIKTVKYAIASCSILLCIAAVVDPEVDSPWYFSVFGIFFVLMSHIVFMTSRKMGYKWILEGKPKPNSELLVQNLGPVLLIFGIFLFWAGTNAVGMADLNESYIPFWTTSSRSWCVFIAGMVLILPGQMAMELAFDQGSLPVAPGVLGTEYRLDGNTFASIARENLICFDLVWLARLLETPLLGVIGWLLMGISSFMPFSLSDTTFQKSFAMTICFTIPFVHFLFLNPALWRSDAKTFQTWQYAYYGLLVALVIAIGLSSGIALVMSFVGVGLIVSGERKDMYDERKQGTLWLNGDSSGTVNPNPQVFGLGRPLNVLGWVMLCVGMSVPM